MGEMGECSPKQSFEEVMDTPQRSKNSQIATSTSKFEDSPVYNFLNSLSPIQPVKATHITQRINMHSFASLPTVFTSPHVSSMRESRFMRRHNQPSDPSNSEFAIDQGNNIDFNNKGHHEILEQQPEDMHTRPSADGMTYDPSYKCSSLPLIRKEYSQSGLCMSNMNPDGVNQINQNKGTSSCDWESLIDASGLFMFEPPNDSESCKKSVGLKTSFDTSVENNVQISDSLGAVDSGEQVAEGSDPESMFTQPGDATDMSAIDGNHDMIHDLSTNNPTAKMNFEDLSGIYRGMRRRCLVFDMGGAKRKHFDVNSAFDSSVLPQSEGSSSANDPQLVRSKSSTKKDSSHFVVPAPGLHLNAILTIPTDRQIVNHEASASGKHFIISSSTVNLHSPSTGQEFLNTSQVIASSEREIDTFENSCLPAEDSFPISAYVANEEVAQSSPKKKKRRPEQSSEGVTCKRCNCRKSKCLKLYCECFAAGVYCVGPCACIDCFNKPVHEETVLATRRQIESRNPLAFAPRVIKCSDSSVSETVNESSKTPASARHKRGCNCKKSGCLKKYCECYQGGVGCSINCRCEGCKNAFGRKQGCDVMNMEFEFQEDDVTKKSELEDKSLQKLVIKNDREHRTPLQAGRHILSKNKSPRSSGFSGSQGCLGKQSFSLPASSMLRRNFVEDEEIPEILQGSMSSPISNTKSSSSPNGKRVSSPHGNFGMRNSRKLILQSIPSFPSSDL